MGFQALLLSFLIIYLIMHLYILIFTNGGVYKLACKIPDNVTVLSWYKPAWAYYHICLHLQAGLGGDCVLGDWRDSQRWGWTDPRDPGTQAASLLEASHGQACSCTHMHTHTQTHCTHLFLLLNPSLLSAVGTSSLFSAPRMAGATLTEHLELDLK